MSQYSLLIARLQHEVENLERTVNRAVSQAEKANNNGDPDYYDATALNLQKFYMGAERIFAEIARDIDGSVPRGANWHQQLLQQMALENGDIRPAVLSPETYQLLDMDFRGFRHVATHLYAFELKPVRIRELAQMLPDCFQHLTQDINQFCQYLQALHQMD